MAVQVDEFKLEPGNQFITKTVIGPLAGSQVSTDGRILGVH
jgi:hypothetical protein